MNDRIARFISETDNPTPYVIVDLNIVENNYTKLKSLFPSSDIYYAVKANPAKEVIATLNKLDSCFDTASINEIKACLRLGVDPNKISYGNTIKKQRDIKIAYDLGIRLFAFDSENELYKIANEAPGSRVFCRILTDGVGAEWPLSRKFGCETDMATNLLVLAHKLNLVPYGISFHVGSQQTQITAWKTAIDTTASIFHKLQQHKINLEMINLGGGFPIRYIREIQELDFYAKHITQYMNAAFGNVWPRIIFEPGRSMVGDSGVLVSEVVLVSHKSYSNEPRWVYLDIGKFGGLAETMDESIRYLITTNSNDINLIPSILAGPTCDSADILYEKTPYMLPQDLKSGDKVYIEGTGAYTTSYSSVGFNGFEPLKSYFVR